jgi:hypothetical protein
MTILSIRRKEVQKREVVPVLKCASRNEEVWGSGCTVTGFVSFGADGGEWSTSRPVRFTSSKDSWRFWKECWMDRIAGLVAVEEACLKMYGIEHRLPLRPTSILILITKYPASSTHRKRNSFILCSLRR